MTVTGDARRRVIFCTQIAEATEAVQVLTDHIRHENDRDYGWTTSIPGAAERAVQQLDELSEKIRHLNREIKQFRNSARAFH